jgi:hypothetical protein
VSDLEHHDDLAIVGSGGAAFAAAIAARRKGRRVVMVERGRVGGTCVNTGCVPSKALLAAASARHAAAEAGQRFPGIATQAGPVDLAALLAGKRDLVEGLRQDKYVDLAAAYGWEVVNGRARFVADPADGGGPALVVDLAGGGTRDVRAAHYLVATGSAPFAPPIPGLDQVGYLTSTTAMELDELPRSMLVVGGNWAGTCPRRRTWPRRRPRGSWPACPHRPARTQRGAGMSAIAEPAAEDTGPGISGLRLAIGYPVMVAALVWDDPLAEDEWGLGRQVA